MHEIAYKFILVSGIGVIVINMNPLIKLDGYFFFCELVGIIDLKEKSTSFVSSWARRNIFHLPVEVDYLPPRRVLFYVVYALLSGAYSYLLLYLFARFIYNILRSFSPDWAFVPALGVAYLLFRSRIRKLASFMRTLYLDKKQILHAWFTLPRTAVVAAVLLAVVLMPVWPDCVAGRFLLEPVNRAVVRAAVPGYVSEVLVDENKTVAAGAPLVQLRNLQLETEAARARADFGIASSRSTRAQLRYGDFASAERERLRLAEVTRNLEDQVSRLRPGSPMAGLVMTPQVRDLAGRAVEAGTLLAEVADVSQLRARVYLPEYELRDIRPPAAVTLHFDALFGSRPGTLISVAAASSEIAPGLMRVQDYRGLGASQYYVAFVAVPNPDGSLRDGMAGLAKIQRQKRSIAFFAWRTVSDFVRRKLW